MFSCAMANTVLSYERLNMFNTLFYSYRGVYNFSETCFLRVSRRRRLFFHHQDVRIWSSTIGAQWAASYIQPQAKLICTVVSGISDPASRTRASVRVA